MNNERTPNREKQLYLFRTRQGKENAMDYLEWSLEYKDTADEIEFAIKKLQASKQGKSLTEKKEIDLKISKFRTYYYECMEIARHLLARHEGVG